MYARPFWRPILLLALAAGVVGCASQATDAVATGAPGAASTSTTPTTVTVAPSTTDVTSPATAGTVSTAPVVTTTLAPSGPSAPSPVAGLSAADLRAAVLAPATGGRARVSGPVAEQVRLPNGTSVWRVRIPGAFPVRAARVTVFVAGRRVGQGVLGPRLRSLVAVTRSGAGIRTGAAVTFRWDGSSPVSAGQLTVVR